MYDLPENMTLRKPDPMLNYLVKTSKDMITLTETLQNSLDPSFIYFDKSLSDIEIDECILRIIK